MDVAADSMPQHLYVRVPAEQRIRDRTGELRFVGHEQCDVPQHVDDAAGPIVGLHASAGGAAASLRQNTSATRCSFDEK